MNAPELARRLPWHVTLVAAALMMLGCLAIDRAEELADGTGQLARRQLLWAAVAMSGMFLAAWPNYRVLARWSGPLFLLSLALLLVVFAFPPINGAQRWMRFGPIGLQPSELAKLGCIMLLARRMSSGKAPGGLRELAPCVGIVLVPMLLILRQPDLGTALVFVPVAATMFWAAGARGADLARLALLALLLAPVVWTQMSPEQRSRITALLHQARPGERLTDQTYHLYQSKQMLALGGLAGSWLGGEPVDDPSVYHLPEAHTDFVLCVLAERYGLWGVGLVLMLHGVLLASALSIAGQTREPFGRLVAVGIAALVGTQVLVNAAMTVGLAPITGLSLPLVSYGGSGLLASGLALGLLLNIALRRGYDVGDEPFQTG